MIEFIDKTSEKSGTPINRDTMMALQGFITTDIVFNDDGSIVELNSNGEKLTTYFNKDGSITEEFIGEKTITKTTKFSKNGSVIYEEVIS